MEKPYRLPIQWGFITSYTSISHISTFQHLSISVDGCFDFLDGFLDGALQLAAAGILVSASIKELRCHLVAREVAYAAKAQLHGARVFRVLVDKDAELDAEHREGDVDEAFRVAVLDLEAPSFLVGERHDGSVAVVQDFHVDVEQVALQSQTRFGSRIEDVAVDLVLVDALCQQAADEFIDGRAVGVEREGTRVAHHGGVEANGFCLGDVVKLARLAKQVADDFARGAHLRLGKRELAEASRVEMMVDEDAWRILCHDVLLKTCEAVRLVEVAADDEVGLVDGCPYQFLMLGVGEDKDVFCTREPFEEVGKDIRHDNGRLLAFPLKVMPEGKRRAYGIAVGIDMGADDDVVILTIDH